MWAALRARLRRPPEGATPPPTPSAPAAARPPDPAPGKPGGTSAPGEEELFGSGVFGRRLDEATVDDVLEQLEIALLESDVALPVIEKLEQGLRQELAGRRLRWGVDAETAVRRSLERTVRSALDRPRLDLVERIRQQRPKPYVILFLGVNGTGKTTTIAKIALWLKERGLTSVIAAGDTFRAGAIEQLLVHGERLGIRVVRQQEGSDPAAVAFDAIAHARAKEHDAVLVDTAGRQNTNENLIEEAKKIRRIAKPNLTLFVGDALSGHDVLEQARRFEEALGFEGAVLTKLDADAKGGAGLSLAVAIDRPIVFLGTGQGYADLRPFDVDWMVRHLFGDGEAK